MFSRVFERATTLKLRFSIHPLPFAGVFVHYLRRFCVGVVCVPGPPLSRGGVLAQWGVDGRGFAVSLLLAGACPWSCWGFVWLFVCVVVVRAVHSSDREDNGGMIGVCLLVRLVVCLCFCGVRLCVLCGVRCAFVCRWRL